MKNKKGIKNRSFFFLISFLFLTSLLSIKTLKKVDTQDIRISGSELFSQNDVIKNSSLNFPIRLIFVETNLLEKELKQNLSLKNVSVNRELFPFGLKVHINSRIPIAYGERILNDEKILGFIDKDGIFINKQNVDEKNLNKLNIKVFGWKEKFKKILSEILTTQQNYEFELVKITFSPNGFLTVEEKEKPIPPEIVTTAKPQEQYEVKMNVDGDLGEISVPYTTTAIDNSASGINISVLDKFNKGDSAALTKEQAKPIDVKDIFK